MEAGPEYLTLGAAARASNRSKATLSRAVRSGRLPAKAADDNSGGWLIRRADLDRIFPPRLRVEETVAERSRATPDHGAEASDVERLRAEVERLRERLQASGERLVEKDATITDLRSERDRLLAIVETQAAQVKLLTGPAAERRAWWRRLVGKR